MLPVFPRHVSSLAPGFAPAALWNQAYQNLVNRSEATSKPLWIGLERPDGSLSRYETRILSHEGSAVLLNRIFVGRLIKFLLWSRGASCLYVCGPEQLVSRIREVYGPTGSRRFDAHFIGRKVYKTTLNVVSVTRSNFPESRPAPQRLGRHSRGCRVGLDIGGTHRRCAAVQDGQVVFTAEVPWDPYFQSEPDYHIEGIRDSIKLAASRLPRVDAIGAGVSGVYFANEPRAGTLFRGVAAPEFESRLRPMFRRFQEEWAGVPFEVVNDGEVTALAGSMALQADGVLGLTLGSSVGAGYITDRGELTGWLNELAFAPVDYSDTAPVEEWTGDRGCAASYFSQVAVAQLATKAGLHFPASMKAHAVLREVQQLMSEGDERAVQIYRTLGIHLGYTLAHYADFYAVRQVLLLGRIIAGVGGEIISETALQVLADEFPTLAEAIRLHLPMEREKQQAQAVTAASLPEIKDLV